MKIEITLEDPKSCDGCPCMDRGGMTFCNVLQEHIPMDLTANRNITNERPQRCIDENGE